VCYLTVQALQSSCTNGTMEGRRDLIRDIPIFDRVVTTHGGTMHQTITKYKVYTAKFTICHIGGLGACPSFIMCCVIMSAVTK